MNVFFESSGFLCGLPPTSAVQGICDVDNSKIPQSSWLVRLRAAGQAFS